MPPVCSTRGKRQNFAAAPRLRPEFTRFGQDVAERVTPARSRRAALCPPKCGPKRRGCRVPVRSDNPGWLLSGSGVVGLGSAFGGYLV